MPNLFIVPIEPLSHRYTKQWYDNIPYQIAEVAGTLEITEEWRITTIDGESVEDKTSPGAFLDFGATNAYKASQIVEISRMFSDGEVVKGDKFLITDAWNFVVTAIKYMSELMDIPVEIHGIWHAGHYDPTDILGMKMSADWPKFQETAWFHACDYNYYASNFHKDMFLKNLKIQKKFHKKAIRSGQPHSTIVGDMIDQNAFNHPHRKNLIVFPHRLNEDKQPEIFRDLVNHLPDDWAFYVTQDHDLDKEKYYNILKSANIVFSCSLHENLGISQMEGVLCGAMPIMPDRASYTEMYQDIFKYDPKWTESWKSYLKHRNQLVKFCVNLMKNYESIHNNELARQHDTIVNDYMTARIMYTNILTK